MFLWNYQLLSYGASQLKGQLNIIIASESIESVLQDNTFPDSLKYKLKLVQKIKHYAIDSIGLVPSNSYETVFNQNGKPILKIITACKPYELDDYTWSFPFLGEVSYKGFFNEEMLDQELNKIKLKKYDYSVNEVTAWSTLGWFKDPILTNFLKRSDGMLSNLIIHELTHGTIYIKSDVYFNENLANFIGHAGAKAFLKSNFGGDSPIYKKYISEMKDEKTLTDYVVSKANELDSLYQTFEPTMHSSYKDEMKQHFMNNFIVELKNLPITSVDRYIPKIEKLNNTYFQSFRRYNSNIDFFEKESHRYDNLKSFVNALKIEYQ